LTNANGATDFQGPYPDITNANGATDFQHPDLSIPAPAVTPTDTTVPETDIPRVTITGHLPTDDLEKIDLTAGPQTDQQFPGSGVDLTSGQIDPSTVTPDSDVIKTLSSQLSTTTSEAWKWFSDLGLAKQIALLGTLAVLAKGGAKPSQTTTPTTAGLPPNVQEPGTGKYPTVPPVPRDPTFPQPKTDTTIGLTTPPPGDGSPRPEGPLVVSPIRGGANIAVNENYGRTLQPGGARELPFYNPVNPGLYYLSTPEGTTTTPTPKVGAKEGGPLHSVAEMIAPIPFQAPHTGLSQGAGGGQDDTIDAKLSDGEFVFDADTVAALGDGSTKEGARKLDELRRRLRAHKRSAPASSIPPKAKPVEKYLKG
jgi:hypothetical protein